MNGARLLCLLIPPTRARGEPAETPDNEGVLMLEQNSAELENARVMYEELTNKFSKLKLKLNT